MKTTKIIHQFLNEPELIGICDNTEVLLYTLAITQIAIGATLKPILLTTGTITALIFLALFKLRRPINRPEKNR